MPAVSLGDTANVIGIFTLIPVDSVFQSPLPNLIYLVTREENGTFHFSDPLQGALSEDRLITNIPLPTIAIQQLVQNARIVHFDTTHVTLQVTPQAANLLIWATRSGVPLSLTVNLTTQENNTNIAPVTFSTIQNTFELSQHSSLTYSIDNIPLPDPYAREGQNVIIVNTTAFTDDSYETCTLGEAIASSNEDIAIGGCRAGSSELPDTIILAPTDGNIFYLGE